MRKPLVSPFDVASHMFAIRNKVYMPRNKVYMPLITAPSNPTNMIRRRTSYPHIHTYTLVSYSNTQTRIPTDVIMVMINKLHGKQGKN